ncbi:MAG: acyl CoA:acetate/3-ketoacid CoA transferase [Hyphomicrobiaceae bacterium]|nr:acyl CoA:acetate/3-ketoacid CoA transferase [Hyphomicrobiaceae bacterium]
MQIISADAAARLIEDSWTIIPGGFGCCGHPEAITAALGRRFRAEGRPRNLSLLFAAGSGDRCGRGLDHLAQDGLVRRAIGGFWGFTPRLGAMAVAGKIDAHNWPQGVISQLFRATAARLPGVLSRVGIGTFIDPDQDGGCLNATSQPGLIRRMEIDGASLLFYPTSSINCALIRGTHVDEAGNLTMEHEVSYQDGLAQAQAARNCGGIVIAQVAEVVARGSLRPQDVRVPGSLIDYVVVADEADHPQTYAEAFNPAYVEAGLAGAPRARPIPLERRVVARRALEEMRKHPGALVNLGIGIPSEIGLVAHQAGYDDFTLTVESGQFGGIPASGLSFGASAHSQALIEQSAMFDLYDGGGIDIAFLGFAQVDSAGNVNVSHFPGKTPGIGGFANISRAAKRQVFCGTFTAGGLDVDFADGALRIRREGRERKFVPHVPKISFNGGMAARSGQPVTYITERAVFELNNNCLKLKEVAPGIDIDRDIVGQMGASILIGNNVREMDRHLFE